MENVFVMDHPLIQHKISMLRDINTGTNEFRRLVEEIGIPMGYEALRDLPTEEVDITTPIEKCKAAMISGKKLAVIPVLRAGLGMVNSILTLVPSAKVGHIGLYRDPVTHEPHEYYCKLPESIGDRIAVVVDPMLATGALLPQPWISLNRRAARISNSCALSLRRLVWKSSAKIIRIFRSISDIWTGNSTKTHISVRDLAMRETVFSVQNKDSSYFALQMGFHAAGFF